MSKIAIVEPKPEAESLALSPTSLAVVLSYPSILLPPQVRPALMECWLAHNTIKGLEKNSLAIAVPMSVWLRDDGLTEADAAAILRRQQRLANFGNYNFASELVNAIAEQCRAAVATRRREAETAERGSIPQASIADRLQMRNLIAGASFGMEQD